MTYKLPEGWKEVKLGDVVKLNYGKSLPKRNRIMGDIPLYSSGGITGYHNDCLSKGPGVIVGRKGTIGSVYYEPSNYFCIDTAYYIEESSTYELKYIFYLLKTLGLEKLNSDTAVPGLNRNRAYSIKVKIPSLKEQEVIANTLSTLDDKIENNNKIAKNLEAQAQAIFKHWFVNFEFPNEEGKPYKSSGGEMEESELGMIPKGWEIVKLKDELEFLRGVEPGSKNYLDKKEDDNLPFYRVGEMISETNIYVKEDLLKDRIANKDDILVSFDGTVGRVRIGISGGYSTGIRKIFSKGEYFPKTFIYYLFKSKNIQDIIKQHATGTTILHASKSIDYMYIPYNKNIIKKFDGIFNKVFRKLISIQEENKKLEELRDTLLPKLISGELRIPLD